MLGREGEDRVAPLATESVPGMSPNGEPWFCVLEQGTNRKHRHQGLKKWDAYLHYPCECRVPLLATVHLNAGEERNGCFQKEASPLPANAGHTRGLPRFPSLIRALLTRQDITPHLALVPPIPVPGPSLFRDRP